MSPAPVDDGLRLHGDVLHVRGEAAVHGDLGGPGGGGRVRPDLEAVRAVVDDLPGLPAVVEGEVGDPDAQGDVLGGAGLEHLVFGKPASRFFGSSRPAR